MAINLHLAALPDVPPVSAHARYSRKDYTLMVRGLPSNGALVHRSSVDSLTLSFSAHDHVLLGFDAYTNVELWERQALVAPDVDAVSAVAAIDRFDEHGIAAGGDGPVHITYSEEPSLMLITFGNEKAEFHVRALSCAIVGLAPHGMLVEIWVEDVAFED